MISTSWKMVFSLEDFDWSPWYCFCSTYFKKLTIASVLKIFKMLKMNITNFQN